MNVESTSSFESLVKRVNNEMITLQQLLVIFEQLVAAYDHAATDFT